MELETDETYIKHNETKTTARNYFDENDLLVGENITI